MSAQHFAIYFSDPAFRLSEGEDALGEIGVEVARDGEILRLSGEDLPRFAVRLLAGDSVAAQARKLAEGVGRASPEGEALSRCDRCFVVDIEDFDEALDEINTMMEVQAALQDATGGVLLLSWNGHLSLPYAG